MAACICSKVLPFVSGTTIVTNRIASALIAAYRINVPETTQISISVHLGDSMKMCILLNMLSIHPNYFSQSNLSFLFLFSLDFIKFKGKCLLKNITHFSFSFTFLSMFRDPNIVLMFLVQVPYKLKVSYSA